MGIARRGRAACVALLALSGLGCLGSAANHERLGDRAYRDGRYGDALVEYRLALVRRTPAPGLRVKAGAAALRASRLADAAQEYVALAAEGGEERSGEAADGLARVANRAIADGDREALAAALDGLQRIAPGRALGGFATQLATSLGEVPRTTEALSMLMYAAASAPDARIQDSLMYAYGVLLRRLGRCAQAVPVFESIVRRQRHAGVVQDARDGLLECAVALGRQALDAGRTAQAEDWFRRAAREGGDSRAGRAAYIGLGDARFARGDFVGAAEAFQRAMAGAGPGDSLYAVAAERLNAIARAATVP